MNFVPMSELTKREYLNSMIAILEEIYAPEAFFRRVVPAHLAIRRSTTAPIKAAYAKSLLRLIYRMGVREAELRRPFWRVPPSATWSFRRRRSSAWGFAPVAPALRHVAGDVPRCRTAGLRDRRQARVPTRYGSDLNPRTSSD